MPGTGGLSDWSSRERPSGCLPVTGRFDPGAVCAGVERSRPLSASLVSASIVGSPALCAGALWAHWNDEAGAAKPAVTKMAVAPEVIRVGIDGAVVNSDPMNGRFASGVKNPAFFDIFPTETRNIARTTAGSNWDPAFFVSSWRASSIGNGFLYARAAVITAKASATATIRALSEISVLARPLG